MPNMRDERFAELAKYLQSVDSHVERNPEWLSPALDALWGCGVRNEFDLVGLEYNAIPSLPQGVHFAFLKRALEKANVAKIAKHAPSEGESADSVTKLVKALRKEEEGCKGHVREGYRSDTTHDDLALADRFRQVRDCCPCDRPIGFMRRASPVLQLAVGASARGRRARVALIYDELVRHKCSDKSLSGDARLDTPQVAGVVDEAAFRQAEADFDARVRQPKVQAHKSWCSDADKGTYRQKGWGKWGNKRGNRQQDQEEDAQHKKRERH